MLADARADRVEGDQRPAHRGSIGSHRLKDEQLRPLAAWIDLGAAYDKPLLDKAAVAKKPRTVTDEDRRFWSFRPLARPTPPPVPDVPTLLLVGGDDDVAPLEGAREIAAELPHSSIVTIPDWGHGVLEDDPLFNAGRGACYNTDEEHELDAAVMDGVTRRAGAVAAVNRIRNPVLAARAVMEKSRHVLLVGRGAERFARAQGVKLAASIISCGTSWNMLRMIRMLITNCRVT